MSVRTITYFGYGSLVNRDTRPPDEPAACARLHGWHRVWGHRSGGSAARAPSCSLTIDPDAGIRTIGVAANDAGRDGDARGGIDGVVVSLPIEALAVLDARESGYERLTLPATDFELPEGLGADEVHVYRSLPENRLPATPAQPILQTYVDCVLAGYLRVYGEGGLDAFLSSTNGWEGAIENDRAAPRYPRAIELPAPLLAHFDRMVGARRGDPSTRACSNVDLLPAKAI